MIDLLIYLGIGVVVIAFGVWAFHFLGKKDWQNDPQRKQEELVLRSGDESLIKLYQSATSDAERAEIAGFAEAALARCAEAAEPELPPLAADAQRRRAAQIRQRMRWRMRRKRPCSLMRQLNQRQKENARKWTPLPIAPPFLPSVQMLWSHRCWMKTAFGLPG